MRIAIASNGPGELSGWVRPLAAALQRADPRGELALFFVPDDFATGREPEVARALFPRATIVPCGDYVRFALGRRPPGVPERADLVLYLGGDLLHAARLRARLGARAQAYKFSRRRFERVFERVYAVDERNRRALERAGVRNERIDVVGNLAVDGALAEAAGAFAQSPPDPRLAPGTILFMPGARKLEIANVVPLFLAAALALRRHDALPIAFALSPFTRDEEIERALRVGGVATAWGARGRLVREGELRAIVADAGGPPIPVVHETMRYAPQARFAVTIPGTKCIELAALGVPALVCVPLNAPEVAVINGPLQYLDRLGGFGRALKRSVVIGLDRRFAFVTQPNIDAGEALMPELRGTLFPGEIARRIAAYARDDAARARASERLRALYADHAGAAERMARAMLR
ncbi:MAG: hypothetical protein ACREM2_11070 [Vulcanimicrobiaceae bacterium]